MRKPRKMLVADLLCGAGGSSTGAMRALRTLGLEMELVCLNHWPTAIETHTKNHPEARHYVQDIATVRPHLVVPEGYLDLLMASPSCTHHSVARGGKPTSDQQRSDPWHIITWFTELRVKRAIIENVWEFTNWGPVDHRTGKPIKSRKGEYFRAWVDTIWRCGATSIEWRKLNAADYGDATTRQRFIMFIRFDGKSLSWPVPTHHKREEGRLELFPTMKPWRAAKEIIDWGIRGRSIFGRARPLAPKTLVRIYAGALKFGWPEIYLKMLLREIERSLRHMVSWGFKRRNTPKKRADRVKRRKIVRDTIARFRLFHLEPEAFAGGTASDPMVITLRRNGGARSVNSPIPTLAAGGTHVGIAEPVVVNMKGRSTASSSKEPLPTQTAHAGHLFSAEPVVISTRQHNGGPGPRPAGEPLPTLTATDSRIAVAEPVIVNGRKGNVAKGVSTEPVPTLDTKGGVWLAEPMVLSQHNSGAPRSTDEPLPTITTGGAAAEDHPGCARPMLVTVAHGNSVGDATADTRRSHSLEEPLGAVHGDGGSYAVVEPFVLNRHGDNGGVRAHSTENPMPTADIRGAGYLIEPFVLSQASGGAPRTVEEPIPTAPTGGAHALIAPYYGSGSGETCNTVEDSLPTITAKARFGMVVPVTQSGGGATARDLGADPLPTMTTAKGGEFAVVIPVTHAGGEDRVLDPSADPLPTVTGANRGELAFITAQHGERPGQAPRVHDIADPAPTIAASGHVDLVEPDGHDILFRMLEPHELAAAMGFTTEDETYEFAGTKTEQIKQIGNAVSVRKMEACVGAMMADAAPKRAIEPEAVRAVA